MSAGRLAPGGPSSSSLRRRAWQQRTKASPHRNAVYAISLRGEAGGEMSRKAIDPWLDVTEIFVRDLGVN